MLHISTLFLPSRYMCMESQDHSQVQWLARRTPRTQHIVLQIEKGHKAKSAKGKSTWGEIQKKLGASFQESFPRGVTQDTFNSSGRVVTAVVKHLPRKLIRDSGPGGLFGVWPHRHPVPGTHQNSRLSEGRQEFSVNHLCANNLGTVSLLISSGDGGNPPKIHVSRCQPKASSLRPGHSAHYRILRSCRHHRDRFSCLSHHLFLPWAHHSRLCLFHCPSSPQTARN